MTEMRDYLEQREKTLEKRIAELEAALQEIANPKVHLTLVRQIARKALGLETR